MAVAFLQNSFLIRPLPSTYKPTNYTTSIRIQSTKILCVQSPDDPQDSSSSRRSENNMAKLAVVAMAAGVLTLGSVDPASAAKSGGRVGGQAFKSSAPRNSSPRINSPRKNIYVNPPVAPPLVGGYGYGVPFYGGWGWSPFSFYAPGPGVAVGVAGGLDSLVLVIVLSAVAAVIRSFFQPRDDDEY